MRIVITTLILILLASAAIARVKMFNGAAIVSGTCDGTISTANGCVQPMLGGL